jgi:phosphoglycerate dehydrogenase-like enzyme
VIDMMKVLIADSLADGWQDVFQTVPDIQVDVKTGLSEDDLCEIIGDYAGLFISKPLVGQVRVWTILIWMRPQRVALW